MPGENPREEIHMTTDSRIEPLPQDNASLNQAFETQGGVALFGALGFLAGVATVLSQLYLWARLGEWIPIPVSALFEWLSLNDSVVASFAWIDAQRTIIWIFGLPLSLAFITFGFAIGFLTKYLVTIISRLGSRLSH